jgi:hypothetical protein
MSEPVSVVAAVLSLLLTNGDYQDVPEGKKVILVPASTTYCLVVENVLEEVVIQQPIDECEPGVLVFGPTICEYQE